jgi:hypothetical protein
MRDHIDIEYILRALIVILLFIIFGSIIELPTTVHNIIQTGM